jgi:predicted DNA-binding transcriptional regulator YafY
MRCFASRSTAVLWAIAEYLYGEREWTMERIAEALSVSKSQVGRDLDG